MTESTDQENDFKRLHVGLPLDPSGYLRHECPGCGLEFKIAGDEARFTDALDWWASKVLVESGVADPSEGSGTGGSMACPYCETDSTPQDFLHAELQSYVRRVALREIVEPLIFQALRQMEERFARLPRGRGMFSIGIKVEAGSRHRSPRPIAGPDADDMVRVRCLGCDERFKVIEGWAGAIRCPVCAASLALA
ncbi:MAG: hypothetical protein RLZZ383_1829 [Pseudomonadota bacterium]